MSPGTTAPSILVIEDEDAIADVVIAVAAKAGYLGRRAVDGRDGLKQFFENRADLVVLDVGLPKLVPADGADAQDTLLAFVGRRV